MYIVDAHQDIAYNALCFNRNYRRSALKKREFETGTPIPQHTGIATIGLPEAIAGRVALIFATLFVAPRSKQPSPYDQVDYATPQEAYRLASQQLDYYDRIVDDDERLQMIKTQGDLEAVLATWEAGKPIKARKQGLVVLMEGADPIIEPPQFEEWYERGARIVGLSWRQTRYAGGTGAPGPLTDLGRELLNVMMDYHVTLDLSHISEQAYFEALDAYDGSIIASHSNPRKFSDSDRHLTDNMILALAERDGVMGVVLYNKFLDGAWTQTDGKRGVTMSRVVEVIDYVCQLTGSARHVGIGSDFDGGFGAESVPLEIDTVADLWRVGDALRERGFDEDDVAAIMGGNMTRKLRESLP